MRKSTGVVAIIVVLGAAYVAGSWYVGQQAQEKVHQAVERINSQLVASSGIGGPGDQARLVIDKYHRNVFSSQVTYMLHFRDDMGNPRNLQLQDDLQHGPFPLGALQAGVFKPMLAYSTVELQPTPYTQVWFDSQRGTSPVVVTTRLGFRGDGQSVWNIAPTNVTTNTASIDFSGTSITVQFADEFREAVAEGRAAFLAVRDQHTGERIHLKNMTFDGRSDVRGEQIKTASGGRVESITLQDRSRATATLENVAFHMDSEQNGQLLGGHARYDFGRIAMGQTDLGSLSMAASIADLDMVALRALTGEYDAIRGRHGVVDGQGFEATPQEEEALRQRLYALLASNPSFSLDRFVWKNAKGESQLGLRVAFTQPETVAVNDVGGMLAQALQEVRLDISVARPMLIQAFGQLQANTQQQAQLEILAAMIFDQYVLRLREAGLVAIKDDKAVSAIVYKDDAVQVNGQSMSVDQFMQHAVLFGM